jgi:hypothetical protein
MVSERLGVPPKVWFLTCSNETRRERIATRGNPRDQIKLADWDRYLASDTMPAFDVTLVQTDAS